MSENLVKYQIHANGNHPALWQGVYLSIFKF